MSAAPAKTVDPSMEEILASIRRIIADDDDRAPASDTKGSEPAAREESTDAAPEIVQPTADADEILDLASFEERIKSDTSLELDLPDLSFQMSPAAEELASQTENPTTPEPQATEPAAVAPPIPEVPQVSPLLSAEVKPEANPRVPKQSRPQTFEPRAEPTATRHPPSAGPAGSTPDAILSQATTASVGQAFNLLSHTIMSQNQNTLEDLVREMLKPMLKTWLDDNLPPLVERLVTAEIQRVARGQR